MNLGVILLILLVIFLVGGFPLGVYQGGYGHYYGGGLGTILVIVVVLLLLGRF
jgi:hypothetical protein